VLLGNLLGTLSSPQLGVSEKELKHVPCGDWQKLKRGDGEMTGRQQTVVSMEGVSYAEYTFSLETPLECCAAT